MAKPSLMMEYQNNVVILYKWMMEFLEVDRPNNKLAMLSWKKNSS